MAAAQPAALVPKLRFPEFRSASSWKQDQIGNIARILKGKGLSKADIAEGGATPCIRYAELYTRYGEIIRVVESSTNMAHDDLFLSEAEDVIVPASGETRADIARAACVVPSGVALGIDLNILRSGLHGPFFSYMLNSPLRYSIAKLAQGDTVAHLYPSQLSRVTLAIPSRPEQQKIADCLGSLDDLIAAEGRKLEALRQHKQALMQQLFPQPGETVPRLRFPEFRNKPHWQEICLGELVSFRSGGTPSKANPAFWNGSIPWVSGKDMKKLFLDDTEDHISAAAIQDGAKQVPAGTVLILTRGMMLMKDVPICVIRRPMSFNQDIRALRPKGDLRDLFIPYLLLAIKQSLLGLVDVAGHGTGRLDTGKLKALEVMFPEPPEQQRIADCLGDFESLIPAAHAKLATLQTHKQALLQQLFPAPEAC